MTLSEKNLFPFFWLPSLILSFKIGRTGKGRWEGWRGGMRRKQRRHHCDLPLAERACGRRHVSPSSQGSSLSEDGERTLLLCGVSLGRSTESKPLSLSLFSSFCHSTLRLHLSRYDISPLSLSLYPQFGAATQCNESKGKN